MSAEEKLISSLRAVINEYPGATGSTAALLELKRRLAKYDEAHPAGSAVKVRIAVAVGANGDWHAYASDYNSDWESAKHAEEMLDVDPPIRISFVEADVPVPMLGLAVRGEVKEPT